MAAGIPAAGNSSTDYRWQERHRRAWAAPPDRHGLRAALVASHFRFVVGSPMTVELLPAIRRRRPGYLSRYLSKCPSQYSSASVSSTPCCASAPLRAAASIRLPSRWCGAEEHRQTARPKVPHPSAGLPDLGYSPRVPTGRLGWVVDLSE